jgi:hypothetical protein
VLFLIKSYFVFFVGTMADNESGKAAKYRYKIIPNLRLSGALEFPFFAALEYYFDHEAETFEELDDELYSVIGECAQSLWFNDYKEVELWVNAYGLAKAMRESECSFDDLLSEFQAQGDAYSFAHDETIYVRLLATIIRTNGLVSVAEIDEKEAVEELEAGMTELAIPESD